MKKFSKITNYNIPEKKEEVQKETFESVVKNNILDIIDKTLRIQSHGSVDNRFLSGSVKIEGKEMLAEAIIDFLAELTQNKEVKVLESLKNEIKDWDVLDKKIENVKAKQKSNYLIRTKVNKLIERYKGDKETLKAVISEKIKNVSDSYKTELLNELKKQNLENLLD